MNKQRYRLVFSDATGMLVPVAECARRRGKRAGGVAAGAATLAGLLLAGEILAASPLPVAAPGFVSRGAATHSTAGHTLTVKQTSDRAVLNWNSFDIGAGYAVDFQQPSATSAALNKIGGTDPSIIQGSLTANGHVYLVNGNGILFANGAQINVGGLVASALNITDDVFMNGLLSVTGATPVFTWEGGAGKFATTTVRVEHGAVIRADKGGRVMLLGPRVENRGRIETPEGQTILAAGAKVYLAAPLDPNLRGFLVEVDPYTGTDAAGNPVSQGGTVSNEKVAEQVGQIIAERGNITLAGLAVNQSGLLRATTAVDLNGSIYLQARDTVTEYTPPQDSGVKLARATRGGALTFGSGSVTEVLPDETSSRTLLDEQVFNQSVIAGAGRTVHVQGAGVGGAGAVIRAPGGEVRLTAARAGNADSGSPGGFLEGEPAADARVYVDKGARIDVAGLRNVEIPIERNIVEVELRGNELRDSPLQREGILRGEKVLVDVRTGTPLADVSGYAGQIQRGVKEKSSEGGRIVLRSEGDVVVREGATLDVSGGSLEYLAGDTGTTKLVSGRMVYDIGEASPDRTYTGFVKDTTHYEAGYVEGKDAGSVEIIAGKAALDGTLKGSVVAGPYQRQPDQRPLGGRLLLASQVDAKTGAVTGAMGTNVRFGNGAAALPADFGFDSALPDTLALDTGLFGAGGFTRLELATTGRIDLPAGVRLATAPGGEVALTGGRIAVDGVLATPGGTISLATASDGLSNDPADYAIDIGPGATLSAAGTWVNDLPGVRRGGGADAVFIDGGKVSVKSAGDIRVAAGGVLDVSGGGWLDGGGEFKAGDAGSIGLQTGFVSAGGRAEAKLSLKGELRGYALSDGRTGGDGGELILGASNVSIGGSALGLAGELHLTEALFRQGGFKDFRINGAEGLAVAAGTRIAPAPQSRVLARDAGSRASGSDAAAFSSLQALPAEQRSATSVALSADGKGFGNLTVERGAQIVVDPGGRIALDAGHSMVVDGTLSAPGGRIALALPEPETGEQFEADRAIWLGSHSRLLAQGYARLEPDAAGLRRGEVHGGGSVEVRAGNGYLVTQAGSRIDVSGTQATLDILGDPGAGGRIGYAPKQVGSEGGSITLAAHDGLLLDGDLAARGGAGALGGSLAVELETGNKPWPRTLNPAVDGPLTSPRRLTLAQTHDAGTAAMPLGQVLDTATHNGRAVLAADKLQAAGFADVALRSEDRIEIDGSVSLEAARSISLAAPNLAALPGGSARLAAAHVAIGNTRADLQGEAKRDDASGGDGSLRVDARDIELAGNMALQGFGSVTLNSRGDLRLRAMDMNGKTEILDYRGSFVSGGDITVRAAQVYPTTFSDFALEIHNNPNGTITVKPNGADVPVLSAGGTLTLAAPHIEHDGVLKAPFGAIELKSETITRTTTVAADGARTVTVDRSPTPGGTVRLGPDSRTSVSAEGQRIPFGRTDLSGKDWIYAFADANQVLTAPPEKRVSIEGDSIDVAQGAAIDLSGGGDMLAWEFTVGPGGSRDVLDPLVSPNTYAIVPSLQGRFAPYDEQSWHNVTGLKPGDSIQILNGVAGLPAGTYVLLPARYALLPGAYTVTFTGGADALTSRAAPNPDGSWQVGAYRAAATQDGYVRAARSELVEIAPGDVARTKSEYRESKASGFFAGNTAAQQTGDAGRLSLYAGNALTLDGTLDTGSADGGRGAEVDISAERLAVSGNGVQAEEGFVELGLDDLNRLGAASLLLGGTRRATADGTAVQVGAAQVQIDTGAGQVLAAPEVILAASGSVTVKGGSTVAGQGTFSGSAKNLAVAGDGALLRTSSGGQVALSRSDVTRSAGVLDVQAGATVRGKSVILDATNDNRVDGEIALADHGALTVGANRISAGETAGVTEGLVFSNEKLARLGNPESLLLKSYSTLDLYGNAVLGGEALKSLTVEAAGIAGYANTGKTATLAADEIRFANPDAQAFPAAGGLGDGTLEASARTIVLGEGAFAVKGFAASKLTAEREIRAEGSGSHGFDGDLSLTAGRITAAGGSNQKIAAGGTLETAAVANPPVLPAADFGGRLEIAGSRVVHGGRIDLQAGVLTLSATGGDAADGLTLAEGSRINAAGVAVAFADTFAYAPGGEVRLESRSGDVSIAAGARVDVSGAEGGNAGRLEVRATNGTFNLAGEVNGGAAARPRGQAPRQGEFALDARSLADFSALNTALNTGGFTEARNLRVRQGDVAIGAADTVNAHDFVLAADGGRVDVSGRIDASGSDKGGRIELHAATGVALHDGARLIARAEQGPQQAFGTRGRGGSVTLDSLGGQVEVKAGSGIDVAGAGAGAGGTVLLRAARTGSGATTDLAIAPVAGEIAGAADVAAEGVKVYNGYTSIKSGTTSGTALGQTSVHNDSNADFSAANVARMQARLGFADTATTNYRVRPGVEVRSAGDLTLSNDWDLRTARYNGEPGALTLRAAGDVKLNNTLSDGFDSAALTGKLLAGAESWSYRIVAGADTAAANPLTVQAADQSGGRGDVVLAANKLLRTGSGSIQVSAGRDVVLSGGAAIYTAGKADDPGEFNTVTNIRSRRAEYAYGGGDLSVSAGRNIAGSGADQSVNQWLYRQGSPLGEDGTLPATGGTVFRPTWWLRLDEFKRGIGALGGGDVSIAAGGNIENLGVAIPTTGRLTGAAGSVPDAADLEVLGGGDLDVRAGGDIDSSLFYVARGEARVAAGGDLGSSRSSAQGAPIRSALALGEATADIYARGDVLLEAVFNPTLLQQATTPLTGNLFGGSTRQTYFSTYSDTSGVRLTALNGDVRLANDVKKLGDAMGVTSGAREALTLYPASLHAAALRGDIAVEAPMTLAPSPTGQLELLAGGGISAGGTIAMSDSPMSALPTVFAPSKAYAVNVGGTAGAAAHGSSLLHAGDAEPVRIVAATGDIAGPGETAFAVLPKRAIIAAGRDIRDVSLYGQNLDEEDVTTVTAGRDIVQTTRRGVTGDISTNNAVFEWGGPGRLEVIAGRDIDLGNSRGIITRGNFNNPFLPDQGADLFVMAGAASGNFGALKSLVEQPGQERLREVSGYDAAVTQFMRERTGNDKLTTQQALAGFAELTDAEQRPVMIGVFYGALRGAGRAALTEGEDAYRYGYAAVGAVFPGSLKGNAPYAASPYDGDINLFFSQLKTEQGGGIDIMAPGGMVNAGLANSGALTKKASELGIVTARGGSIRAFVRDNFEVNQSRVFTLQGGDILIWSSYGDIDAGKGAKTASATPPPQVIVRGDKVILDTSNSVAGSGIGVLLGKEGIEPGNVDLIAPTGEVNAGDAGIRSTGNVTIAAARIVGADNISAGGTTSGVPQAESGGMPAPAATNVAGDAAKVADQAGDTAAGGAKDALAPSLFTVEVVGLGEEEEDERKKRRN